MNNSDVDIATRYVEKAENAKLKGYVFELTFSEYKRLTSTKRCAYTGEIFSDYVDGIPVDKFRARTLDRIDNTKGYVKGNVVACIYGINSLKSNIENNDHGLTLEMLEKFVKEIKKRKK